MPIDISLPPVPGDPAGMRALAASLRIDATTIAVVASDIAGTTDGLEFYGPAATRIDGSVRTATRAAGQYAEQLLDTAGLLERAATQVEVEQRQQEQQLERLRAESVRGASH